MYNNYHSHSRIILALNGTSVAKAPPPPPPPPDNADSYLLYVEGAVLTTQKESDSVADVPINKVNRAGSLTHLSDSQSLPGGRGMWGRGTCGR